MASFEAHQAEWAFKNRCLDEGYSLVALKRKAVCQNARLLSKQRRQTAVDYLLQEYSSLEAVPTTELVDRLYGIDAVVDVNGEWVGVDVTTDSRLLYDKQAKLQRLSNAHSALGISRTLVYCPGVHGDKPLSSFFGA